MKARVAHLTGGRAGTETVVWKSYATIGRHPQSDVRLAPDADIMVSARHAALVWRDGTWYLRDLGSTNGTYVDGNRVHGETALRDDAVVQLGRDGPTFRFSVIFEAGAPEPVHTSDIAAGGDPDALQALPRIPVILSGGREVPPTPLLTPAASPRRRRWPAVMAGVAALAGAGWLTLARARPAHDTSALRAALLERADSTFEALAALPRGAPLLAGAAQDAQADVARLRSRVRRAAADPAALAALGDSLARVAAAHARLARAATLDVPALLQGGTSALVQVEADLPDGRAVSAPAVAVRCHDGRTYVLALRAPLLDELGRFPRSLRIVAAGGRSVGAVAARASAASGLVLLAPSADAGTLPVTTAATAPAGPGDPALLFGLDARAALATVAAAPRGELRLEALGAGLPAGSVVLDRAGAMLGVVVPDEAGAPGTVRAMPAADLLRLLEDLAGAG